MNEPLAALLWCVIQVTVLVSGVAMVYLAARRLHPRAGVAAAGGGMAMVLVLTALVVSPWPRWTFSQRTSPADAVRAATAPADLAEQVSDDSADTGPRGGERAAQVELESPQRAFLTALMDGLNSPNEAREAKPEADGWGPLIACAFAMGITLAAARLVWSVVAVQRLARRAVPIHDVRLETMIATLSAELDFQCVVEVRESAELTTAATMGWRRPIVLLPSLWTTWSDEQLRAALAHELAHIAGRDYAAWLVARLAVVAHFYHPLVRWLAARLQLEQELAADMTAARLVGNPQQYLHSLAALALATPQQCIAGPVRTLIPSRSLLVRRVEMLRTLGLDRPGRPVFRYATLAIVALLGIAAAGLRGPGAALTNIARADEPPVQSNAAEPADRLPVEFVPRSAMFAASVRPAELAAREELAEVMRLIDRLVPPGPDGAKVNVSVRDVSEAMFITYGDANQIKIRLILRFIERRHQQQLVEVVKKEGSLQQRAGVSVWQDDEQRIVATDAFTLMLDSVHHVRPGQMAPLMAVDSEDEFGKVPFPTAEFAATRNPPPRWAEKWNKRQDQPVIVAADLSSLRQSRQPDVLIGGPPLQMIAPLINDADWAVAGIEVAEHLHLTGTVQGNSEEAAERVNRTLQALVVLLQNMIEQQSEALAQRAEATVAHTNQRGIDRIAMEIGREMIKMLGAGKFAVEEERVQFSFRSEATVREIGTLAASFFSSLPSGEEARQQARQRANMINLKQLALAMHNYHDSFEAFPAAANYEYFDGKERRKSEHPHSWRVAVLPFIEQQDLYDQYRFDEPWDSEANKKVLAKMPDVYRSPHDPDPNSFNTSYFVLTGPETIFPDEQGTTLMQVADGTSKTILLVEAKRPVPWTKPEDIPYAADKPLPDLGGWVPGQFVAALADGSVHRVPTNVDETMLRAFITKAGREVTPPLPEALRPRSDQQ